MIESRIISLQSGFAKLNWSRIQYAVSLLLAVWREGNEAAVASEQTLEGLPIITQETATATGTGAKTGTESGAETATGVETAIAVIADAGTSNNNMCRRD